MAHLHPAFSDVEIHLSDKISHRQIIFYHKAVQEMCVNPI